MYVRCWVMLLTMVGIALRMQRPGKPCTAEQCVVTTWCRQSKSEYDPLALTLLA